MVGAAYKDQCEVLKYGDIMMTQPVCLVAGVGEGTGAAIVERFARGGYQVAMLARSEERLKKLEKNLLNTRPK